VPAADAQLRGVFHPAGQPRSASGPGAGPNSSIQRRWIQRHDAGRQLHVIGSNGQPGPSRLCRADHFIEQAPASATAFEQRAEWAITTSKQASGEKALRRAKAHDDQAKVDRAPRQPSTALQPTGHWPEERPWPSAPGRTRADAHDPRAARGVAGQACSRTSRPAQHYRPGAAAASTRGCNAIATTCDSSNPFASPRRHGQTTAPGAHQRELTSRLDPQQLDGAPWPS